MSLVPTILLVQNFKPSCWIKLALIKGFKFLAIESDSKAVIRLIQYGYFRNILPYVLLMIFGGCFNRVMSPPSLTSSGKQIKLLIPLANLACLFIVVVEFINVFLFLLVMV